MALDPKCFFRGVPELQRVPHIVAGEATWRRRLEWKRDWPWFAAARHDVQEHRYELGWLRFCEGGVKKFTFKNRYHSDRSTLSSTTNAGYSPTTPTLPPRPKRHKAGGERRSRRTSSGRRQVVLSDVNRRTDNPRIFRHPVTVRRKYKIPL